MIVSTKGRYALRVMIDLAEHQSEKYVPLKEVAARQEISEKYLENILKVLVQNGFLEGLRGKGGGYRLTRSPDQYTVSEILMLTEGSLAPVSCLTPGASACARMANCRTYEMWKGQRLCDLSLAHRNCTGALFCTVLRKRCRTSWQDLRLMGRAVRGILLLCVRQKIPGEKPVVCSFIRPERGVLTRSIFFSSGAFSRSVFWARCCTWCCRCRCLPVCTVWCCCWQP